MRYEKTKQLAMKHYPRLYLTEADFLDHMLFGYGNGYEWFNGELCQLTVDRSGNTKELSVRQLNARNEEHRAHMKAMSDRFNSGRDEIKQYLREAGRADLIEDDDPYFESRENEIKSRARYCSETQKNPCWFKVEGTARDVFGKTMRQMCEYSRIVCMPDDIKPDWLDAAERAIAWAESPLCRMPDGNEKFLERAKARIAELRSKQ